MRFDANHDGVLTRAELIAGLKAEFDSYDTSHRNCLSLDQARAINQLRVQQDASQASPLVDWNQDNCIDFNEYSGATLSLFDSLDTNGDGQLTAAELNPANHRPAGNPAEEPGRGHHGHGRGGGSGDGDGE
jgi:Ca2+-binding EF-hand superfamily protein